MRHNPFKIVSDFEETIAEYTGAAFGIAVDSCTSAIFLCCKYYMETIGNKSGLPTVFTIPSKTYVSAAHSIVHAGITVMLDKSERANSWSGIYQLSPSNIYDAAKRLTGGMYIPGSFMCLSFHQKKHLPIGKGGMILTDDKKARAWFLRASYHGRDARNKPIQHDDITMAGWDMYMKPQDAAVGLALMQNYPDHMPDLTNNYRDLSTFKLYQNCLTA